MTGPGASPAERWALGVAALPGDLFPIFEAALAACSVVELVALFYDWTSWWARPEQIAPEDDAWRSWGFCTGRRFGKTRSAAEYVHREAISGRAMRIALMAQNEERGRDVMIHGDAGLLAVAPPWEKPVWAKGRLLWPNGAQAFLFTPEEPDTIRGPGVHLAWCTELIAWRSNRRDAAWSNLRLMCTLGYGRVVWDTSPRRRHPILRALLDRAARSPRLHRVVRGSIRANSANLSDEAIEELHAAYAGTVRGREELDGDFLDELDDALFQQSWIDRHRRDLPTSLARRVLAVDPAISMRRNTDATGIVECALGTDRQIYVIEDLTARIAWEVWGDLVIERYIRHQMDCIVVERNRGGDAVAANLRTCARERGWSVVVLDRGAITRHVDGVINVKEVIARGTKTVRAEPVSPLYERGRVSHVIGADLQDLEEQLTTWEPGEPSPNAMDALVWAMWELADLAAATKDGRRGMQGLGAVRQRLAEKQRGDVAIGMPKPGVRPRRGRRSSRI